MFAEPDNLTLRLKRFVSHRGAGKADDAPSLIADASIQLLMPALRDALDGAQCETYALRLTCATAMVMITDLLAQRLSKTPWSQTAALAIRHVAERSGLDEAELMQSAGRVTATLGEFQPQRYQSLCRDMDHAIERTLFTSERAQGEVLVRLALERLEAMVQADVVTGHALEAHDVVRRHGLLRIVQTNGQPPWANAPRRRWWSLGRKAGQATAPALTSLGAA